MYLTMFLLEVLIKYVNNQGGAGLLELDLSFRNPYKKNINLICMRTADCTCVRSDTL